MIEEDYVSFEIAKLLREKEFDENCILVYNLKNQHLLMADFYSMGRFVYNSYLNKYNPELITAPTLQMVVKYLEEVYRILVVADYEYEYTSTSWYFKIYRLGENGKPERVPVEGVSYDKDGVEHKHITCYRDFKRSYKDYSTRKEAIEDGIKYCFEKFI